MIRLSIVDSDLEGHYLSCNNCPIAKAFRREFNLARSEVSVGPFRITTSIGDYKIMDNGGCHSQLERIRNGDRNHVILQKCERF